MNVQFSPRFEPHKIEIYDRNISVKYELQLVQNFLLNQFETGKLNKFLKCITYTYDTSCAKVFSRFSSIERLISKIFWKTEYFERILCV